MKKKYYEKIELELHLKGYELETHIGVIGYGCYLKHIDTNQYVWDPRFIVFYDNELKQGKMTSSIFKERTAIKRMLKWYSKNRAVVLSQHLTNCN